MKILEQHRKEKEEKEISENLADYKIAARKQISDKIEDELDDAALFERLKRE